MYRNLYIILLGCATCLGIFLVTFTGQATFFTGGLGQVDFVWNNATEPQTLDPGIMSGQPEGALAQGLFEGLTNYHPQTLRPLPGVARDWESRGLTYVFHLREDAWWVKGEKIWEIDGKPRAVVASDFVFAWRRHLYPETGSEYSYLLHLVAGAREYEDSVAKHWTSLVGRYKDEHPEIVLAKPDVLIDPQVPEEVRGQLREDYDAIEEFRNREWERLVKIQVVNERQLEVTLVSPAPYFLDLTSFYPLCPVPREAIEAHDRQWILPENIVTNGPYRLAEWRFNSYIRLAKNRHYWEHEDYARRRIAELESRPNAELRGYDRAELEYLQEYGSFVEHGFDTADALAVEEQTTSLNLYINGDVDRIREIPTSVVGDLIAEGRRPDRPLLHVHHGVYNAAYFYNLNMDLPVFREGPDGELGRKLRRALALSIDRKSLIDVVTRAHQKPAYRLVPGGIVGYSAAPLFGTGDYARDVREAKRLVEEVRRAGVRIPKLRILYNTHESHKKVAVFIQSLWKTHLGIDVEPSNQEWGVFLDSRRTGNYEVSRSGWIGDYTDPNTFMDMYTTDNQNNDPNYSNPHYDRIVVRYCASILEHLKSAETRAAILDDVRSWPPYGGTIDNHTRPDGRNLDRALEEAVVTYPDVADNLRLEKAFEIRLLLFEVAEIMLMHDQPIIPLYFYTSTQLWPPELENMFINTRDVHPLKPLRWKDGVRPTGKRYGDFPRVRVEVPDRR